MLQKLTLLVIILVVTTQCTLEKRLYNKGYSVSWNRKYHQRAGAFEEEEYAAHATDESDKVPDQESADSMFTSQADDDRDSKPENEIAEFEYGSSDPIENSAKLSAADTVYVDKYYVPSGVASFGFLMGAVAALFGGIYFYFEFLFIAVAVLFLISFVLGIISVVQFRNNRGLYASNTFGIIALVIDSMLLILFLFLVTLLFIYFN